MNKGAKAGIGIGVAVGAIIAISVFTNVDELVQENIEFTSPSISNPFRVYEINTKEEIVCFFQRGEGDLASIIQDPNFEEKYPEQARELNEWVESGQSARDMQIDPIGVWEKMYGIYFQAFSEEYSVHPQLEEFFIEFATNQGNPTEVAKLYDMCEQE